MQQGNFEDKPRDMDPRGRKKKDPLKVIGVLFGALLISCLAILGVKKLSDNLKTAKDPILDDVVTRAEITEEEKEGEASTSDGIDVFDPFQFITVKFEGASPNITARVVPVDNAPGINYVTYELDKSEGLILSDSVKVTAKVNEEKIESDFGKKVVDVEQSYPVEGVGGLVSNLDELGRDKLALMEQSGEYLIREQYIEKWQHPQTVDDIEFVAHYFYRSDNYSEGGKNPYNQIKSLYRVSVLTENGYSFVFYIYAKAYDLRLSDDGTLSNPYEQENAGYTSSGAGSFEADGKSYTGFIEENDAVKDLMHPDKGFYLVNNP